MTIEQTAGEPVAEHVAWLRYVDWPNGQTSIRVCDSDDEGAFKVYAHPRPRVGVTEAMVDAFLSAYAKCELYNGWTFTHQMGVRAGIRAALAASTRTGEGASA